MSGSLNKVTLIGSLGRDPEVKSFQNGGKVVNLRIATSESWKDRNSGERKEKTGWHSVAIFNEGLANVAEQWLRKGSKVYIEGKLQTRKWQDQSGNDRYTTEVVLQGFGGTLIMLSDNRNSAGGGAKRSDGWGDDSRSSGGSSNSSGRSSGSNFNGGGQRSASAGGFHDDLEDDVPF